MQGAVRVRTAHWLLLRMSNVSDDNCREIKTQILCPITPPPSKITPFIRWCRKTKNAVLRFNCNNCYAKASLCNVIVRCRLTDLLYVLPCSCYLAPIILILLPCSCYLDPVTLLLLSWSCYFAPVTLLLLPWSCYFAPVTLLLLSCSCYLAPVILTLLPCSCYLAPVTLLLLSWSCYLAPVILTLLPFSCYLDLVTLLLLPFSCYLDPVTLPLLPCSCYLAPVILILLPCSCYRCTLTIFTNDNAICTILSDHRLIFRSVTKGRSFKTQAFTRCHHVCSTHTHTHTHTHTNTHTSVIPLVFTLLRPSNVSSWRPSAWRRPDRVLYQTPCSCMRSLYCLFNSCCWSPVSEY
jgi:hypothetical protein